MRLLPQVDVRHLDHLLVNDCLQIKYANFYQDISPIHLAVWCHHHGIYGLPTIELIEWLRSEIQSLKAIEIGAGTGAIGRELKIPITDACLMKHPEIAALYLIQGQPITKYPNDIVELDAVSAVDLYQPEVVIGCWVTHLYKEADHWRGGNMFGIDEEYILSKVKKYIIIGNEDVHSKKSILDKPHKEYRFPWLFSRSLNTTGNLIYVWEN